METVAVRGTVFVFSRDTSFLIVRFSDVTGGTTFLQAGIILLEKQGLDS